MGMNPQDPSQYPQSPQYPQQREPSYGTPPPSYGTPPSYGQAPNSQYGSGYQVPPPMPPSANRWGPSSMGMDANLAAGLAYLATLVIGPILAIIFFVEKTNRFVKFHSAQVILLNIAGIVVGIVLVVLFSVFAAGAGIAGANSSSGAAAGAGIAILFTICLFPLFALAFFALWLWGMIAAFTGKYTKLPVIGNIAESWAGGPAVPMY